MVNVKGEKGHGERGKRRKIEREKQWFDWECKKKIEVQSVARKIDRDTKLYENVRER